MEIEAPLLEVELNVHFDRIDIPDEKLQYYARMNADLLPVQQKAEPPALRVFQSSNRSERLVVSEDQIQLISTEGARFPRLRPLWSRLIESFFDVFQIPAANRVSLIYLNEIELQDLRSFDGHLNIGFGMPQALMDRIEFFRSEFRYKYDFGEIHVWLQPDWDDQRESYCIQLSLESRHLGSLPGSGILPRIQQLHDGIKDVFHQILSPDYVGRLPQ